ncbi:MAG: dockerin type I domain-containing protein [Verrucomicrobiota bacterium]|nr:dockerin type I domain-containing protein [Verrucomicrobiota bacterium]
MKTRCCVTCIPDPINLRRRFWRHLLLSFAGALLLGTTSPAQAADGDLDPTFGVGGKVVTDFNNSSDTLSRMAVQPDGKIVAIGSTRASTGSNKYALARYNPDGTLDNTFGTGGKVTTVIANVLENANAILLLPDGKILIGGSIAQPTTTDSSWALLRYNTNGSLDTTFGTGGLVKTNIGTYLDSIGRLAFQADGKIIAAGNTAIPRPPGEQRNSDIALARYNQDGSLDPSFGTNGIVISDFGPVPNYFADDATALLIQPDGKIVIAGDSDGGGYYDFLVARYNTNGTLDATFGNGGFTKTDVGNGFEDGASDAVLQPDGKIICAGWANRSNAANDDFVLLRYNANGALDPTFGTGGKVVFILDNLADEALTSVVLQADGKILALGDSNSSNRTGFLLFRFNPDGSFDPSFGVGGMVRTPFGSDSISSEQILFQPDGKLLAGGFSPLYNTSDFILARYTFGSVQLTGAASRKTHGTAGTFDLPLPLTGTPGVECRSGSSDTLVFTFNNQIASGNVSTVSGTATIANAATYSGNTLTVNLTGVGDAQTVMLTLSNVTDTAGHVLPSTNFQISFLRGDTNGDRIVNSGDALQTRNRSGQATDATNFRSDVNLDGFVNSGDVLLVRNGSGNSLP